MLEALCASVDESEAHAIRVALASVMARLVEARLLGDERLREVARYPDVYLARSQQIIKERVAELGLNACVNGEDVRYLARLLTSGVPHRAGPEQVGSELVATLFREIYRDGGKELRCAICGFHFREEDVSEARREFARQFEFVYATGLHPRRVADALKPPHRTTLHIDHIVPRLGWGPTRVDNLQVLCEFCNQGKLSFRRGLENLSGFAATSVPPLDRMPVEWVARQAVVAVLMTAQNSCGACGARADRRELTAIVRGTWFVPWRLEARCYDCVDEV
jgi:HNH endonuclease